MPASQSKLSKQTRKNGVAGVTHVAIIGAGRGGTAFLEIFANDPLVDIVAVAEIDATAPGLALAKRFVDNFERYGGEVSKDVLDASPRAIETTPIV